MFSKDKMRYCLLHFALKYWYDWQDIYNAIKYRETVSQEYIDDLENCDRSSENVKFITILDRGIYHNSFLQLKKPPFLIFYRGNINILKNLNQETKDDYILFHFCGEEYWKSWQKDIKKAIKTNKKIIIISLYGVGDDIYRRKYWKSKLNDLLVISEYYDSYHLFENIFENKIEESKRIFNKLFEYINV